MIFPPALLRLRVRKPGRRIGLWLPLFVLWPLVPVAAALGLAALVLRAILTLRFRRFGREVAALLMLLHAVCLLRHLRVEVTEPDEEFHLSFY